MKKYLLLLLLFCSLIPINCERETPALVDTPEETMFMVINGSLSGSLTEENSPYHVTEGISVDSLHELSIEEGTRIFFDRNTKFIVEGNLSARGTKAKPIQFTSYGDSGWGGIIIAGTSSAEFSFCTIEKIIGSADDSSGNGAVLIINSSLIMNNCMIENNRAVYGGGIYLISATGKISNTIFKSNYSDIFGGALLSEGSSLEIINNVFFENKINYYGGAIVLVNNDSCRIQNNIFYSNSILYGNAAITITGKDSGIADAAYNFGVDGDADPFFTGADDFHLKPESPCRNAGNPAPEFNDFDGSRNDQGAYGGQLGDW